MRQNAERDHAYVVQTAASAIWHRRAARLVCRLRVKALRPALWCATPRTGAAFVTLAPRRMRGVVRDAPGPHPNVSGTATARVAAQTGILTGPEEQGAELPLELPTSKSTPSAAYTRV